MKQSQKRSFRQKKVELRYEYLHKDAFGKFHHI